MLNIIWLGLIVLSVVFGAINGKLPEVVNAVPEYAKYAFEFALGLTGFMAFWLGLMKIAEEAGLIQLIARLLAPVMKWLFPEVPADHPAMGSMIMNIAANMLGLVNAATPFGLRAMKDLETLNEDPGTATNAMCMFLAINTSSVQLIPTTAIVYLVSAGANTPTDIIFTTLFATTCSTIAAITATKFLSKRKRFQVEVTA